MVLHQVKNWQNWKMQGCFVQFLRLIFVKKLQLRPLTPTGGLLRPPDPHFSADFSILNSHACIIVKAIIIITISCPIQFSGSGRCPGRAPCPGDRNNIISITIIGIITTPIVISIKSSSTSCQAKCSQLVRGGEHDIAHTLALTDIHAVTHLPTNPSPPSSHTSIQTQAQTDRQRDMHTHTHTLECTYYLSMSINFNRYFRFSRAYVIYP